MITTLFAWVDRNYNLLFYPEKCIKITFAADLFKYNDIIYDGKKNYRCLNKQWYIEHLTTK